MARRSTKTERVLNLITSKTEEPITLEENEIIEKEEVIEKSEVIEESLDLEIDLSEKIMHSLEEAFLQEHKDINFDKKFQDYIDPTLNDKKEGDNMVTESPDHYDYINVMEEIIKDKAPEYIEKFGMCSCERCLVDIIAISLSNLTPKYIVAIKNDNFPLLNFYSTKFSVEVSSELTKACIKVMSNPNHK